MNLERGQDRSQVRRSQVGHVGTGVRWRQEGTGGGNGQGQVAGRRRNSWDKGFEMSFLAALNFPTGRWGSASP